MTSLDDLTVIVTRPISQSALLAEMIGRLGGTAIVEPLIEIEYRLLASDEEKIAHLPDTYDAWVSTSANGVRGLVKACESISLPLSQVPPGYAIGDATRRVAEANGLRMHVFPDVRNAADFTSALLTAFKSSRQRLLCVEGTRSSRLLESALQRAGHDIRSCILYDTHAAQVNVSTWQAWLTGPSAACTAVVFYSPSAAAALVDHCEDDVRAPRRKALFVCVGTTTSTWLSEKEIYCDRVAARPSDEAVCEALALAWKARRNMRNSHYGRRHKE